MADELRHKEEHANYDEVIRMQIRTLMLLGERAIRKTAWNLYIQLPEYEETRKFNQLVNEHYMQIISVTQYAELMAIPAKKLIKSVENTLGCHPKDIIIRRRIIEAKRLLAHCTISIKEISVRLGFTEFTNFTKYFRKYTGETPIHYRETASPMIGSYKYESME